MAEFEKECIYCKYEFVSSNELPCRDCDFVNDMWKPNPNLLIPIKEWLSSFDTSSATECFTAVNILKQRLEEDK